MKTKYKVLTIVSIYIALLLTAVIIATPAQSQVAKDKSYGIDGVERPAHLMDLLRKVKALEAEAVAGNTAAQFRLGYYYAKGMLVGKDVNKAVKWLSLAHSNGNIEASNLLGEILVEYGANEQTNIMAMMYFTRAAKGGLAEGQLNLGIMYYSGKGTAQNYNKALDHFTAAAKQDHTTAQYYIGVMYALGHGVDKNHTKALTWYEMAASNGHAYSAYNAAISYDIGRGVDQDQVKATELFKQSAEGGFSEAQYQLGKRYYVGTGTDRILEDAFVWLMVAQNQGHKEAEKLVRIIMPKMTVAQVREAAKRIDKIIEKAIQRRF